MRLGQHAAFGRLLDTQEGARGVDDVSGRLVSLEVQRVYGPRARLVRATNEGIEPARLHEDVIVENDGRRR
jgi:hypothetical protein